MIELRQKLVEAVKEHSALEDEQLIEAAQHGADAGWSGFTYNHEAAEFFDKNSDLIWELLIELAEDLGEKSPLYMISQFNRIDMSHSFQGFKVLLAWFALEEAGRHLWDE